MSRLMPASTPQNARQIKDVHDRTSSWGQVAHSESWYKILMFELRLGGTEATLRRVPLALLVGAGTENLPAAGHNLRLGRRQDVPRIFAAAKLVVSSS
jgi:hypothetical protein